MNGQIASPRHNKRPEAVLVDGCMAHVVEQSEF
jgi:hypothetical protein